MIEPIMKINYFEASFFMLCLNSKNSYKTIRIGLFKLFSNQDMVISILHQNMSSANYSGESLVINI